MPVIVRRSPQRASPGRPACRTAALPDRRPPPGAPGLLPAGADLPTCRIRPGVDARFPKKGFPVLQTVTGPALGHPPEILPDGATSTPAKTPILISMHERDNVAIVANDGGLAAGTVLPSGLVLRDHVPQGHKVALQDFAEGDAVRRYDVPIGYALQSHRRRQLGPRAAAEDAVGARARRQPADRHRQARAAAGARGLHLRGLSAIPTARSARATSWPSRRRCSASPAWSTSR